MNEFIATLRAELLKLKRSLALWLVVIMPSAASVLIFMEFARRPAIIMQRDQVEGWHYFLSEIPSFWAILLLPLFIPLLAALINGVEHGANTWKHLFALPVPRWKVLAAKYVVLLLAMMAAYGVMTVEILAFGVFAQQANLQPVVPFKPFPVDLLMAGFLGQITASLFLIALHAGLSIRVRSFAGALGAGIAGTVISYFLNTTSLGPYFPYSIPGMATNYITEGDITYYADASIVPQVLVYSVIMAILVTTIGIFTLSRRDVL